MSNPFKLVVCSEQDVPKYLDKATHVISIGDPDSKWPADFGDRNLLRLEFADIGINSLQWGLRNGYRIPSIVQSMAIMDFVMGCPTRGAWKPGEGRWGLGEALTEASYLLVHCAQGCSRSPAAALTAALAVGSMDAASAVRFVFDSCPSAPAKPNTLMVRHLENLLARPQGSIASLIQDAMPTILSGYSNW